MIKIVKTSINEFLVNRLDKTFAGKPWFGKNISTIIRDVSKDNAEKSRAILRHMLAWRKYAIVTLKGGESNIEINSEKDWPEDERSLEALLKEFDGSHEQLKTAIINFPLDKWDDILPKGSYTYFDLCMGVIDHDLYHAGQLALLSKKS